MDWYRNVRIVLKGCKKDYVLEATLGDFPDDNATEEAMNLFYQRSDDYIVVQCAMLAAMEPELQKRFENWGPFERINELKGNKLEPRDMRSHRHCLTARWLREVQLVLM